MLRQGWTLLFHEGVTLQRLGEGLHVRHRPPRCFHCKPLVAAGKTHIAFLRPLIRRFAGLQPSAAGLFVSTANRQGLTLP